MAGPTSGIVELPISTRVGLAQIADLQKSITALAKGAAQDLNKVEMSLAAISGKTKEQAAALMAEGKAAEESYRKQIASLNELIPLLKNKRTEIDATTEAWNRGHNMMKAMSQWQASQGPNMSGMMGAWRGGKQEELQALLASGDDRARGMMQMLSSHMANKVDTVGPMSAWQDAQRDAARGSGDFANRMGAWQSSQGSNMAGRIGVWQDGKDSDAAMEAERQAERAAFNSAMMRQRGASQLDEGAHVNEKGAHAIFYAQGVKETRDAKQATIETNRELLAQEKDEINTIRRLKSEHAELAETTKIASTAKTGAIATEAQWHVELMKNSQQIEANQKKMRELAVSEVGSAKMREQAMNSLAQASIPLQERNKELTRQIEHGTGGLKNNRQAMQQLAFGVQDFVSAGGMHNLAQGFRGAANNAEMMAMSLGSTLSPLKLLGITLIPTAALAAVDLATHFGKSGEKADDAAKNGLANYKSALQGIIDKTNEVTQTEFQRDQGKARAQFAEGRKAAVDERQAALDDWKEKKRIADRFAEAEGAGIGNEAAFENEKNARMRLQKAERDLGLIEDSEAKRREASIAQRGIGKHKGDLFKAASEVARGMKAAGATQADIDKRVRGVFRGAMGANVRGDVADEVTGAMMDDWHDDERGHAMDRDIEQMKPGAAQAKQVKDLRQSHKNAKNATRRGRLRPKDELNWKRDIDAAEEEYDRVSGAAKDQPNAVLPALQGLLERVAKGIEEQTKMMREKVDPGQPARLPNLGNIQMHFNPMWGN